MSHALDMINRMAYNRSLLLPHRYRHGRIKEAFKVRIKSITKIKPAGHEISKEEMAQIKKDIRSTIKRERIIAAIKTSVVSTLIALMLGYLIYRVLF